MLVLLLPPFGQSCLANTPGARQSLSVQTDHFILAPGAHTADARPDPCIILWHTEPKLCLLTGLQRLSQDTRQIPRGDTACQPPHSHAPPSLRLFASITQYA